MATGSFAANMSGGKAKLRLAERDGWRCHICGERIGSMPDATRDHVVPLSLGGCTCAGNIALAHRKCNNDRSSSPLGERRGTKGQKRRKGHTLAEHR